MPTKDELIAFASDIGVDVSSSATKAEIEAAIEDAGYDPTTLEEAEDVTETTPDTGDGPDPYEVGYLGTTPDELPNEAYTVEGQGADTAKAERAQLRELHAARYDEADE